MAFDLKKIQEKWIAPLLLIVTGLGTWYFARIEKIISIEKQKIEKNTASLDYYIKEEAFNRDLKFKMFTEVKTALKNKDSVEQKVLIAFINEMLLKDSALRVNFLNIIKEQGAPAAVANVNSIQESEKLFDVNLVNENAKVSSKFKVNIFYLEENMPESKNYADTLEKLLLGNGKYNVTLKLLPKGVNARSGYRLSANEIRYEKGEESQANQILDLIQSRKIFPLEQPILREISFETPNSISVFVSNM